VFPKYRLHYLSPCCGYLIRFPTVEGVMLLVSIYFVEVPNSILHVFVLCSFASVNIYKLSQITYFNLFYTKTNTIMLFTFLISNFWIVCNEDGKMALLASLHVCSTQKNTYSFSRHFVLVGVIQFWLTLDI
jgi:hypothetical protein